MVSENQILSKKIVDCPDTLAFSEITLHADISQAGLSLLYSEKQGDTMNHLRYVTYMHLIVQWKSLMVTYLDLENWGWKLKDGM